MSSSAVAPWASRVQITMLTFSDPAHLRQLPVTSDLSYHTKGQNCHVCKGYTWYFMLWTNKGFFWAEKNKQKYVTLPVKTQLK